MERTEKKWFKAQSKQLLWQNQETCGLLKQMYWKVGWSHQEEPQYLQFVLHRKLTSSFCLTKWQVRGKEPMRGRLWCYDD